MWTHAFGITTSTVRKTREGIEAMKPMDEPCDPVDVNQDPSHYLRNNIEMCYKLRKERGEPMVNQDEVVIEVKHLKMVFIYWAGGAGLAVATFLAELIAAVATRKHS